MRFCKFVSTLLCCLSMVAKVYAQSTGASDTGDEREPFPTWGHVQSFDDEYTFNFRVENNRLRVYFIDDEEQLMETPVVAKVNARVDPRGDDPEFLPLRWNEQGFSFTNPKFIRKPYIMRVNLTLIGEDGAAINSFQFFMNQKGKGPASEAQ